MCAWMWYECEYECVWMCVWICECVHVFHVAQSPWWSGIFFSLAATPCIHISMNVCVTVCMSVVWMRVWMCTNVCVNLWVCTCVTCSPVALIERHIFFSLGYDTLCIHLSMNVCATVCMNVLWMWGVCVWWSVIFHVYWSTLLLVLIPLLRLALNGRT